MKQSKQIKPSWSEFVAAIGVFFARFGMLPPNFTPLGSFGFTSQNMITFYGSIIAFDLLKGGLYRGFWITYIAFGAYIIWGKLAQKSIPKQLLFLPFASFTFFLISNLGVWWYWYPHSSEALFRCYMLAVPFYKNTLLGDTLFGYGYIVLKYFLPRIRHKSSPRIQMSAFNPLP